jgi:hypothetical protein
MLRRAPRGPSFGNGRLMRNMLDVAVANQADRVASAAVTAQKERAKAGQAKAAAKQTGTAKTGSGKAGPEKANRTAEPVQAPTRQELVTITAEDLPPLLEHPEEFFGLYL